MVCSATETALPPGVFMTMTPAAVAAFRSTLSTPTPARPMTRRRGAFSSTSFVTLTALRTSSASASGRQFRYSFGLETTTFPTRLCPQQIEAGRRHGFGNQNVHAFTAAGSATSA